MYQVRTTFVYPVLPGRYMRFHVSTEFGSLASARRHGMRMYNESDMESVTITDQKGREYPVWG